MNALIIPLFAAAFFAQYLTRKLGILPDYFLLLPEALAGLAMIVFIARATAAKGVSLAPRYGIPLGLLAGALLFGYLGERVGSGPIVTGLRDYLKFLPVFLLPTVYAFSEQQIKKQFYFLLLLLSLQAPLAVYQRFVQFAARMHTGDPITGTASTSSALSILMLCGIAALVVLYLRRCITLPLLLLATALFIVPTTLNETKGTLVLLPLTVLMPLLVKPVGRRIGKRLATVMAVAFIAGVAFVSVYDTLIQNRANAPTIAEFFAEGGVDRYLYTGIAEGDGTWIGRFDSIKFAMRELSNDPWSLAFGLGAGNVTPSQLPGFHGEYARYFELYGVSVTQVSKVLWEVGMVGLASFLLFYLFVFRDARKLARSDTGFAVLGHIWISITVIMVVCLLYKTIFTFNEIGYVFWFYSGVVISKARALPRRRNADSAVAALNVKAKGQTLTWQS